MVNKSSLGRYNANSKFKKRITHSEWTEPFPEKAIWPVLMMSRSCLLVKDLAAISWGSAGICPWCWMRLFILVSERENAQTSASGSSLSQRGIQLIFKLEIELKICCSSALQLLFLACRHRTLLLNSISVKSLI